MVYKIYLSKFVFKTNNIHWQKKNDFVIKNITIKARNRNAQSHVMLKGQHSVLSILVNLFLYT